MIPLFSGLSLGCNCLTSRVSGLRGIAARPKSFRCLHGTATEIRASGLSASASKTVSTNNSVAQSSVGLSSADEDIWVKRYEEKYGTLDFGVSLQQGVRESMEDFASVVPKGRCGFLFAAVFDGHGGRTAAHYLNTHLYEEFSNAIDEQSYGLECSVDEKDIGGLCCPVQQTNVLRDSFEHMDRHLLGWLQENADGDEKLSGATATLALVRSDKVVVANVGDSRAVLSRKGEALDLSTEHRIYGKGPTVESEIQRIESVGGWIDDGRVCSILAVSRSLGDWEFKGEGLKAMLETGIEMGEWTREFADSVKFTGDPVVSIPDVTEIDLGPHDEFVIIATDGLWDVLSSKEAVQIARSEFLKGKKAQDAASRLAALAVKRYSTDNASVVVVDIRGSKEGWVDPNKSKGGGWLSVFK